MATWISLGATPSGADEVTCLRSVTLCARYTKGWGGGGGVVDHVLYVDRCQ